MHLLEDPEIRWESAYKITERITREIEREFHTSRPRPRNKAMGFRSERQEAFQQALASKDSEKR